MKLLIESNESGLHITAIRDDGQTATATVVETGIELEAGAALIIEVDAAGTLTVTKAFEAVP